MIKLFEIIIVVVCISCFVMIYVWYAVRKIREDVLHALENVKVQNKISIRIDEDLAKAITEYYINGGFNKKSETGLSNEQKS